MKKTIQRLVGRFTFCVGIGIDQITPEFKTISFWSETPIYMDNSVNVSLIKPKMFNVRPQPFSRQNKNKNKNKRK